MENEPGLEEVLASAGLEPEKLHAWAEDAKATIDRNRRVQGAALRKVLLDKVSYERNPQNRRSSK